MPYQLFKGVKKHEDMLQYWFQRALDDITVWPYLGSGRHTSVPELHDNDWYYAKFIDETETALLSLQIDRTDQNRLMCALWALNTSYRESSAAALLSLVPSLCKRYGMEYIEGGCAESNKASMNMHMKIFGNPCGVFQDDWFNRLTGEWEKRYVFRDRIDEVMKRYKP